MHEFITRYAPVILGVLSGFDRLLFRGSIRSLAYVDGLAKFLNWRGVRLVDFGKFCDSMTHDIDASAKRLAKEAGRPFRYLDSSAVSKDETARQHAVPEGLACVLKVVEPCVSFELHRNRELRRLELRRAVRRCSHYYYYFQHPVFGWMHIRVQSWLPLSVRVCLNGREWLGRQLAQADIPFVQRDNSFVHVGDFAVAQQLLDRQLRTNWASQLDRLVAGVLPVQDRLYPQGWPYYWSAEQTEWATDVLFRSPADLQRCYPQLLRHMAFDVQSADVLRFLDRPLNSRGQLRVDFSGDVETTLRSRAEGTRVKHQLNANWLKMYDKGAVILRTETTINDPSEFKVFRTVEGDPRGPKAWRIMRKGIADVHRRAQVSQAANDRYLRTLAAVETPRSVAELAEPLCQPVRWHDRSARALNPLAPDDARLLEAVSRDEFALHGFRNRDLRALLYANPPTDPQDTKRQAAAVTRKIRLLRAHGLIQKVPKTHRYILSPAGTTIITTLLQTRRASAEKLCHLTA